MKRFYAAGTDSAPEEPFAQPVHDYGPLKDTRMLYTFVDHLNSYTGREGRGSGAQRELDYAWVIFLIRSIGHVTQQQS